MSRLFLLCLTLLFLNLPVFSVGYLIPFQGNRGNGMAYTFTGFDKNAETLWFNPGAAHQPKGTITVSAGISASQEFTSFQMMAPSVYKASTINPLQLPWYLYVSSAIHDRFTIGLVLNSPWSSAIKWQEENWAGRYIVKNSELKTSFLQPTIAFQINDQWHIGAGLIIARSNLDYSRSIALRDQNRESNIVISGDAIQWGVNAGIYYQPNEQLNLGLSYKSAMIINFTEATSAFRIPSSLQSFFPEDNNVSAAFHLPAMIDLHASARISDSWAVAAGAGLQLHNRRDNTIFDFRHNNTYLSDFRIHRNDKNQFVGRVGVEYYATDFLSFRTGMYYQDGASSLDFFSPEKPDANKIGLSAGAGLILFEGLALDFSFTFIYSKTTEAQYIPANFGGTYKSAVYVPGLGITWRF